MQYLLDAEATFNSKNYKIEDGLNAVKQNEEMVHYLREKGIMDQDGRMKI